MPLIELDDLHLLTQHLKQERRDKAWSVEFASLVVLDPAAQIVDFYVLLANLVLTDGKNLLHMLV